jgi:hypothetical protein
LVIEVMAMDSEKRSMGAPSLLSGPGMRLACTHNVG